MKYQYMLVAGLLCLQVRYAQAQIPSILDDDVIPDYVNIDITSSDEKTIQQTVQTAPVEATTRLKTFIQSLQWESKAQFQSNHFQQRGSQLFGSMAFRVFGQTDLNNKTTLLTNIRLRVEHSETNSFQLTNQTHLDLQELALRYQINPSWNMTLGRNNIRNGVASGFNPTDWFKSGSLVYQNDLDPSARRDDRLGIFSLHTTWSNENVLIHTGYRPDLSGLSSFLSRCDAFGRLCLGQSNPKHAYFFKLSPAQSGNLAWTASIYQEDNHPGVGFEASFSPASSLITYIEWFVQRRSSLFDATLYGDNHKQAYYHQLSLGAAWSIPWSTATREFDMTATLEFHYNGAGLGKNDLKFWRHRMNRSNAGTVASLAQWRQEPMVQQQIFFRFAWNDMLDDLNLSSITTYVPWDQSGFIQLSLAYLPSQRDKIELLGYRFFGANNSSYGASQKAYGLSLAYTHQF